MIPIPKEPRYNLVNHIAYSFLLRHKISKLPFNPYDFLIKMGCSVKKYSFHAKKLNCSILDIIEICESKDGYSVYDEKTQKYKITFNDIDIVPGRIRWTLTHELAHIILKHFIDFEQTRLLRGGITNDEYEILDKEADAFVSKVLAPEIVLLRAEWFSPAEIQKHCYLSHKASENKSNTLKKLLKVKNFITKIEFKILNLFFDYIYSYHCPVCKYTFINKDKYFYCPICGNDALKWGKDEMPMHYKTYQYSPEGKVLQCVRCENEDIEEEHTFCIICGAKTTNSCYGLWIEGQNGYDGYYEESKGCKRTLPPNARFCPYCGGISEYRYHEIIKHWEDEYKELKKQEEENNTPSF